jgi:hypothetical protein
MRDEMPKPGLKPKSPAKPDTETRAAMRQALEGEDLSEWPDLDALRRAGSIEPRQDELTWPGRSSPRRAALRA